MSVEVVYTVDDVVMTADAGNACYGAQLGKSAHVTLVCFPANGKFARQNSNTHISVYSVL